MKRTDQISAAFWLLLAIYVCSESLSYGLMEKTAPGPGFVPILTGIVMGFLSITLLITSGAGENNSTKNEKKENVFLNPEIFKNVLLLSAGLIAYAILLDKLGFIVSMSMLMTFLFSSQNKRGRIKRWLMAIFIGLSLSLISYLIFSYLLSIPLPKGFFGI